MDQEIVAGYVEVDDGVELFYEACGSGQAVVLVHAHSVDRRMWDDTVVAASSKQSEYLLDA